MEKSKCKLTNLFYKEGFNTAIKISNTIMHNSKISTDIPKHSIRNVYTN